jgi:hypothetical protein
LVPSAGKVMASVFWDAEGILYIDYLEKDKAITGEYYSNLLTRLDEKSFFIVKPGTYQNTLVHFLHISPDRIRLSDFTSC